MHTSWKRKCWMKTPVKVFKAKKDLPALQVPGLALEDVPTQVVYGHVFKPDKPTPLQEMGQDAGKVTVWGDVFATELKGNYYKIYSISHHRLHRLYQCKAAAAAE